MTAPSPAGPPDADVNRCPICGDPLPVARSDPPGDRPCPRCGHLLWFPGGGGESFAVVRVTGVVMGVREQFVELRGLVEAGVVGRLVLDFRDLPHLFSDAAAALVLLQRAVGAGGGRLKLRNLTPRDREFLQLPLLARLFEIEP